MLVRHGGHTDTGMLVLGTSAVLTDPSVPVYVATRSCRLLGQSGELGAEPLPGFSGNEQARQGRQLRALRTGNLSRVGGSGQWGGSLVAWCLVLGPQSVHLRELNTGGIGGAALA